MNYWTKLSVDYANQRNYLDDLFQVYPTIPEGIRDIDQNYWKKIERAFNNKDDDDLIKLLLGLDLFPIKDSYVAYLKRDPSAIERNPKTIARLCGRLREMGLTNIFEKCSEPKETNRQIGPLFRRWLHKRTIGAPLVSMDQFLLSKNNAILDAGDAEMMSFANKYLNYKRNKGLDFVGRFNEKYVIGEAKFLTDFGGHQNAQFADGISTIEAPNVKAIIIGIFDGVCYIKGRNKLYMHLEDNHNHMIMSALVLREFLHQV